MLRFFIVHDKKPVILINILDYEMLDVPEYCTKTVTVAEKHREYEVINDVTYWFIELPKFRKSKPKLANLLECWLALIDDDRGLIKMAEEKNEIIREANEEVEEILSDEELKAWNDYLFTAKLEENSRNYRAKKEGREEGLKQGVEEGRKEGIEQGIKQGIEKGKEEEKIEIAKEMLKLGMKLEEISKITKLTIEEIRKIDQN